MKRKVESAHLKGPAGYPIGGETSLYEEKQQGIVMYTGVEPGFLTVHYKDKELGIPLSNVNAIVWEKEDGNTVGRDREDKTKSKESKSAL